MSRFVTVKKADPQFKSYLLGTFSAKEVALPVQSLNVNTESEVVTFEVLPAAEIQKPSKMIIFLQAFKVHNFVYVLFPLLLVLTKNYADHRSHDLDSALLSAMGVLFGFIAANLRNDYQDHLNGFDRLHPEAGSRVIQKGWMTAAQARVWSYVFLALALLCGLPLTLNAPELGLIIVGALFVALWAQFSRKTSFKYQIGGELSIFVLFGPLLALGYQVAMGAGWDLEVLMIGALWGWLLLFLIHLKNFSQMVVLAQGKFHNTITWMGFDQARGFIAFWWVGFICLYFVYHMTHAGLYWGWYLSLMLLFFSTRFLLRLKSLNSPVGSDVVAVNVIGRRLFFLTIFLWTLENMWYIFTWKL